MSDAVAFGRQRFPGVSFYHADATKLPFNGPFDVVYSSGLFTQIPDDGIAAAIASEVKRVVRPGGRIIVRDAVYRRTGNAEQKAVTRARRRRMFGLPLLFAQGGALIPPVGRFFSRCAPRLYYPAQAALPFLTGTRVYVMKV